MKSATPSRPEGGGCLKFLLWLVFLAAVGFGVAGYHFGESPAQVWHRLIEYARTLAQPAPLPSPTPAPTPAPTPTPTPTPTPAPTPPPPTPAPTLDPLSWILMHKEYWPREVTLLQETEFPAVYDGKITGSVKVPPGTKAQVVQIDRENIAVVYNGGGHRVPINATDLLALATSQMAKAEADARAAGLGTPAVAATSPAEAAIPAEAKPMASPSAAEASPRPALSSEVQIYAGGVAGAEALADPDNSTKFREAGGGAYLHNNGWAKLSPPQQQQVVATFKGLPFGIELGFGGSEDSARTWAGRLKSGYLDPGITPAFVASNAFANNNKPTPEQWNAYAKALHDGGLPVSSLVLPTFEFANFGENLATLPSNTVSRREDFQQILTAAGGIVLDCPPGYAFGREANYREWIVDAIHWAHNHRLIAIWISSPHNSGNNFRQDTEKFLRFLHHQQALPNGIVVENYNPEAPASYPNIVGNENKPNTTLGVALYLIKQHPH